MRKLILLVVVASTLYGGYWFVGRAQVQAGLTEAIAEINSGTTELTYGSLKTRGFPSRFDTTVTDIAFKDPVSRIRWDAPFFQVFALSYRPNEVIAVFANEQVFTVEGARFTLFTNDMRASGKVRANSALSFVNTTVTIDNPRLRTEDGAELAMASLLAAARLTPDTTQTYDMFMDARGIVLPDAVRRMIDPENTLPQVIQSLRFDTAVGLDTPIALNSQSTAAPRIETVTIKEIAAGWGDMSLSAIGDLTADAAGFAEGSVTLSARNWQQALDLAVAGGLLDEAVRLTYATMAAALDETPHITDTLTVTLMLSGGQMRLGPIPIGPAPRF